MIAAVLCGATASGKSALAFKLAKANGFEIIAADSRQIYRGFEIGTNAPTELERQLPHHLLGFLDPIQNFSPRAYPRMVHTLLAEHPHTRFLVVGGTGLYLKELLFPSPFDRGPTPENIREEVREKILHSGLGHWHSELLRLDPEGMKNVHPNDTYRIAQRLENQLITGESYTLLGGPPIPDPRLVDVPVLCIGLEREELYSRIDKRVTQMLAAGWMDEVRNLMSLPDWESLAPYNSLGYADFTEVAKGLIPLSEAIRRIRKQTRNYAKRQVTFFSRQLPSAIHWNAHALESTFNGCDWSWETFLNTHRNGQNPT